MLVGKGAHFLYILIKNQARMETFEIQKERIDLR